MISTKIRRLLALDAILQSPKLRKLEDIQMQLSENLGEHVAISTLQLDFEVLRKEYDAPLQVNRIGNNRYYHYTDKEYSLKKIFISTIGVHI